MACGCQGGARQTVTTADVQASMNSGEYTVTAQDGEVLYQGTSYLAAMRAKNANRDRSAVVTTG